MKLTPGTVMIEAPTAGCSQEECFVCTGPRDDAKEAFLVGMALGALSDDSRPKLCLDHEAYLRETLSVMGASAAVLTRLGIGFKVSGDTYRSEDRPSELRDPDAEPCGAEIAPGFGCVRKKGHHGYHVTGAPDDPRSRPTEPAPAVVVCKECGRELEPVRAVADGQPTLRGHHPCPDHPEAGSVVTGETL